MPSVTANAKVTRSTAAHLRGQATLSGKRGADFLDPGGEPVGRPFQLIMNELGEVSPIAAGERCQQRLDMARRGWHL
jgi:hypothetical protein